MDIATKADPRIPTANGQNSIAHDGLPDWRGLREASNVARRFGVTLDQAAVIAGGEVHSTAEKVSMIR